MDGGGANVEPGKIFVGGLSWETSKEGLRAHFEKYGEVDDCVIMMDPVSKRPRGFGFVTFKDPASVKGVMTCPEHVIDSKKVDPKPATVKTETPSAMAGSQVTTKKVFVGGISSNTKEDDIRAYFSAYGTVTDVDLKYDKNTSRMRGFGFVGFETEEIVEQVCQTRFHQLNGKTVEVKRAEPRYATASAPSSFQANMAYGGANTATANYGGYGRGGAGYPYPSYGYGYGYGAAQQQQQQTHAQQYGYGASSAAYGGQSYGQFGQGAAYTAGTDRNYYTTGQQTGTGGQQQMTYGQDSSAYARNYTAGTDGYSGAAHSTAGYTGYDNQAAAASYQQYTDTQAATYGRGMAQQGGVNTYQRYGSH